MCSISSSHVSISFSKSWNTLFISTIENELSPIPKKLNGSSSNQSPGKQDGHETVVQHRDSQGSWAGDDTGPHGVKPCPLMAELGREGGRCV